jgi:predicted nucleic acid-binding protein
VTVLDTSGLVDYLLGGSAYAAVGELIQRERVLAAPDLAAFEALSVLRRLAFSRAADPSRLDAAVEDLGDFPVRLFPSLPLRRRAWEMRENLTTADALFVALAEQLGEPLATKDAALLAAAASRPDVDIDVIRLA